MELKFLMSKILPIWENGRLNPASPNKVFCMAPWTHTYISPQGERRLCCASREQHSFQKQYIDASNDKKYGTVSESKTHADDFNPLSLKEHWNSDYMKDIRRKLMAGEKISQCDVCNDDILSINSYRNWFTGTMFSKKIQEAFDATDETGFTTMEPISFDYRYSNICNFKCRMCGEQLSSSWEAEKKKYGFWTPEQQPFMIPEVKEKMEKFQIEVVEPEFKDAISRGIVEECYWVGGEPLMYEIHWWALEEMIKNGSAKDCFLRYNSNLSRIEYFGKNLYDYLPQFKNWIICASIDGTGEIVEYIRKGIKWEKWLSNFKEGLKLPGGNEKMLLDLTITGPGMFALKDLFNLALELNVRIETKIMFAFHPDVVLSPFAWPRHILDRKIDELLEYMEPRSTNRTSTLVLTLRDMKKRLTFQEQFGNSDTQFFNGRNWHRQLDAIRGDTCNVETIYKQDPELYAWWTR